MKKMILALALILLTGLSSSAYAVHCWNTPEIIQRARRLDVATQRFQQTLYDVRGYHHIKDGVHELSSAARRLHRHAERPASCEHVRKDFERVERNYQRVRYLLQRAHTVRQAPRVIRSWQPVREAYLDAQGAVYASLERTPRRVDPYEDGTRAYRDYMLR
jgi:hypothetical protein